MDAKIDIKASRQDVWEVLTNHAEMGKWADVQMTLEKEGDEERNGKGALRRAKLPGLSLLEEVVHFEAPSEMHYVIRSGYPGLAHHLGTLKLSEQGGGTHIDWHVEAEAKPLHPMWFLQPIMARLFGMGFQQALNGLKKHMEAA